jgi:hypothetical protein
MVLAFFWDGFSWSTKKYKMNKHKDQNDKTLEDSFPASDPPANTGITGPRVSTPKAEELDDQDERQKKNE